MLKISNISKKFGEIEALQNVSFSLNNGEVVALLGENGAGKSTLLRIISGFFEADSGKVVVDGAEIKSDRMTVLKKIGYVQEISSLYGDLSVFEFLNLEANLREVPVAEMKKRVLESAKSMELQEVLNQSVDILSKGFKKRVELAGVLLANPEILLLDEPTEGLDPNQKSVVRNIIKQYAKNHIVVISTHTMEDVDKLASRVLLIHKGKLLADTNLQEFKNVAQDDLAESFKKLTEM